MICAWGKLAFLMFSTGPNRKIFKYFGKWLKFALLVETPQITSFWPVQFCYTKVTSYIYIFLLHRGSDPDLNIWAWMFENDKLSRTIVSRTNLDPDYQQYRRRWNFCHTMNWLVNQNLAIEKAVPKALQSPAKTSFPDSHCLAPVLKYAPCLVQVSALRVLVAEQGSGQVQTTDWTLSIRGEFDA